MAAIWKTFLGGSSPENQPSGAEIIEKLKTRYYYTGSVDLRGSDSLSVCEGRGKAKLAFYG